MDSLRVALLSSGLVPVPPVMGGAVEEYVFQLAKNMRRQSINAVTLDRSFAEAETLNSNVVAKLRTIAVPSYFPKKDILQEFLFGVTCSRKLRGYDLAHANTPWVGLSVLSRACSGGLKLVYTCHNPLWPSESIRWEEKLVRKTESLVMRRSHAVVALNETMKKALNEKAQVPLDKLNIVPNGVDTSFFKPFLDGSSVNKKFKLYDKRVILFVGKLSSVKNVHVLLKAYKILVEKHGTDDLKLCMAGPLSGKFSRSSISSYAESVMDMAHRILPSGSYVFTGAIEKDELRRLYSRASIFVLPSNAEAFPLVLLEAMSSGCPLLGSAAGGIIDIIKENKTGFLFEVGDFRNLARYLETLLLDERLRTNLSSNCRRIAETVYDWGEISKRLFRIYTDLLE